MAYRYCKVVVDEVVPLRHRILREGRRREVCYFPGDYAATTFHLAVYLDNNVVGIASFYHENHPQLSHKALAQYRLRGMATSIDQRGRGIGKMLVEEGERLARAEGGKTLWCNARKTAVDFYRKMGFAARGEEFHIDGIGAHYLLFKSID